MYSLFRSASLKYWKDWTRCNKYDIRTNLKKFVKHSIFIKKGYKFRLLYQIIVRQLSPKIRMQIIRENIVLYNVWLIPADQMGPVRDIHCGILISFSIQTRLYFLLPPSATTCPCGESERASLHLFLSQGNSTVSSGEKEPCHNWTLKRDLPLCPGPPLTPARAPKGS